MATWPSDSANSGSLGLTETLSDILTETPVNDWHEVSAANQS